MQLVKTSYDQNDVIVLLKDLTSVMQPMSVDDRERLIQSGAHYSSMLPKEELPTAEYLELYKTAVTRHSQQIAQMIAALAGSITKSTSKNHHPVIVSLARAGIPIGILLKRFISRYLNCTCSHYAISIVRGKGIDNNAMEYIYSKEIDTGNATPADIFFVDGWTGKGAIHDQLVDAVNLLIAKDVKWYGLHSDLYVLADPANITSHCGTHSDLLLPTACLNSIVSGLISRSILNEYVDVNAGDFHGAVYFSEFESKDMSNAFINDVSSQFAVLSDIVEAKSHLGEAGISVVRRICDSYDISDYFKVKPGIGETTRVLLRRIPWAVLLSDKAEESDPDLQHIFALCKSKGVKILPYDLGSYKVCGIIKELNSDV